MGRGIQLGVIVKDGKVVNHRSLVKCVCNPILNLVGLYLGSEWLNVRDERGCGRIKLARCERLPLRRFRRRLLDSWLYDNPGSKALPIRRLW